MRKETWACRKGEKRVNGEQERKEAQARKGDKAPNRLGKREGRGYTVMGGGLGCGF